MGARKLTIDRNTLYGFLAILLWSTTIALARSLTEKVGTLGAGASVYLIGGGICIGRLLWFGQVGDSFRGLSPWYLWGCGILFVGYMVALYLALGLAVDRNQAIEIGLLNYLWPALTLLFSLILLNKKASFLLIPGTGAALVGVFMVLSPGAAVSLSSLWINVQKNPAAYSLGLVAALTWALYSNLTRRWAGANSKGAVDIFIPATGLLLGGLLFLFEEQGAWNVYAAAEACFLGLATVLAYAAWDIAMRKGDLILVAAFSYLTPLLSTVVSYFYLGVTLGFSLWLGCVLIVAGSLLSWVSVSNRSIR